MYKLENSCWPIACVDLSSVTIILIMPEVQNVHFSYIAPCYPRLVHVLALSCERDTLNESSRVHVLREMTTALAPLTRCL